MLEMVGFAVDLVPAVPKGGHQIALDQAVMPDDLQRNPPPGRSQVNSVVARSAPNGRATGPAS